MKVRYLVLEIFKHSQKKHDHHIRNNNKRNPLSKPLSHSLCYWWNWQTLQTYQHKTFPRSSYINHIIMYKDCPLRYTNCEVHNAVNTSDNQPVSFTIKYNSNTTNQIIDRKWYTRILPPKTWMEKTMHLKKNFKSNFDELDKESNLKRISKNQIRSIKYKNKSTL